MKNGTSDDLFSVATEGLVEDSEHLFGLGGHIRRPLTWGYVRVAETVPDAAPADQPGVREQQVLLRRAGVKSQRIVVEVASSARQRRPRLDSLIRVAHPGDTIVVTALDRLARSTSHLLRTIATIADERIMLRSLEEGLDTGTPEGRVALNVITALAGVDSALIKERTEVGMARARKEGRKPGRPSRVTREQYQHVWRMSADGASHRTIARSTGVSRSVVGRILRHELPTLEERYELTTEGELPL
ncbi:DNA-invertase hin [Dermatophilus congolensis]|uniref:DNA-invertase hin n=1 Tax=Dermatophilus congolensis TaxID=1863 RepID=A0AA46BMT1_9MICO|nr:recombinase family protein [Dermatophilus congolensis]STD08305.1 DNA-invertase hin [Dermatophilus congolensis]